MTKKKLIEQTYNKIVASTQSLHTPLSGLSIKSASGFSGPRVGVIELQFQAEHTEKALSALQCKNCVYARQLFDWNFPGSPQVFMSGSRIRLEANWPDDLADTKIPLSQLATNPHRDGAFTVGLLNNRETCVVKFDDITPHFAIVGATGSGKSVLLSSLVAQLGRQDDITLALVDMKGDDLFLEVANRVSKVAQVARTVAQANDILQWLLAQLRERYKHIDGKSKPDFQKIVLVVDEVSFINEGEPQEALREIARLGRSARIHLALATQDARKKSFGGSDVKDNITGRLVGRVSGALESYHATGLRAESGVDASNLQMQGDFYVVVPGRVQRCQVAYLDKDYINKLPEVDSTMNEIMPYSGSGKAVSTQSQISNELWGAALFVALYGKGRRGRTQLVDYCNAMSIDCPGDYSVQSEIMSKANEFVCKMQNTDNVCLDDEYIPIEVENWPKGDSVL